MIPITTKCKVDVCCRHTYTVCAHAVQGDAYTRAVECELYHNSEPWYDADGADVYVSYQRMYGQTGEYRLLPNGQVAGSVTGNKLYVILSPDVTLDFGLVSIQIRMHKDDNQTTLPKMHLAVQRNPGYTADLCPIERSEICAPYAHARIAEVSDGSSAVEITIAGIYEGFVTGVFLEYILRPFRYNEPVMVSIESGEFDLVNGHIYRTTIPVAADFWCRAVLHYVTQNGEAKILESRWEIAPCSACGGIHSDERLNYPHNDPVLYTHINPYLQKNNDQSVVEVYASTVNGTVNHLILEYVALPVEDEFEEYDVKTFVPLCGMVVVKRREYIHTEYDRAITVPIEVEGYDFMKGHSELITIPVSSGYACRAVLQYTQRNGCKRVQVSKWNVIGGEYLPET